ncbi:MAG: type II toxin-antitoxin system RelE/ParE family toxin [Oscillospiraceae bacterium]|jgi:phage-related protein|nr:type II toxin-antitoxin system RelE/ParE family toxin [Oscillospiraceae bacterium]
MFEIKFFETESGERPVEKLLNSLEAAGKTNKTARLRWQKLRAYIDALAEKGTWVGQPITKHLSGEIWELRPLDDRVLYFFVKNDHEFVLLHHFIKKTNKTPPREIERAKREMQDYLERNG